MISTGLKRLARNFTAKPMTLLADILSKANSLDLLKEVETLLCDYLNVDSSKLFLMRSEELSPDVLVRVKSDIARLGSSYPLAYIRGKADFYGLEFIVNENVLIPRPETEMLVDKTIECIKKLINARNGEHRVPQVKMIELGVGSGCIAVAVATEFVPGHKSDYTVKFGQGNVPPAGCFEILGIEKSCEALEVARENVRKYSLKNIIKLREGDLLDGVEGDFDILVGNLPYVDEGSELGRGVREYEPHEALFAGEGGLALYRKVFEQLLKKKMRPEYILFEIGFDQGGRIIEMCNEMMPDYDAEILKDLENRDRVLKMNVRVALEKIPARP